MRRAITLTAVAAAFLAGTAAAKPFETHSTSKLLDFEFGWSTEVSAIPALVRRFTAEMREQQAGLTKLAKSVAADPEEQSYQKFHQYSANTWIQTAGQTPRLLSVQINRSEFTGGAHPLNDSTSLIWDRQLQREIRFTSLLVEQSAEALLLRSRFCRGLHDERTRRDGQEMGGVFDQCPTLSRLTILPRDSDRSGKFDAIHLIADQDVAGSHGEGAYDVSVPVTPKFIAALRPQYRASFEVQRQ